MECAAKFLEALTVELQGVNSLRLVWCQRSQTVWLSGGMRRRFGFNTTSLDQLAYWGLAHPEDHARLMGALDSLRCSSDPVLLREVRLLLAPGLWEEFDVVYSRLRCGGGFGERPEACDLCGLVMVSMCERVRGRWVEVADVLEAPEATEAAPGEHVVTPAETVEPAEVPAESVAIAREVLEAKWRECEALLDRVHWVRMRTALPGDEYAARRVPRRGKLSAVLTLLGCGCLLPVLLIGGPEIAGAVLLFVLGVAFVVVVGGAGRRMLG